MITVEDYYTLLRMIPRKLSLLLDYLKLFVVVKIVFTFILN